MRGDIGEHRFPLRKTASEENRRAQLSHEEDTASEENRRAQLSLEEDAASEET